jgi:hypothetical protein
MVSFLSPNLPVPFADVSTQGRLRKILKRMRRGNQYVEHTEGDDREMFQAICKLGLEGIVSKKLDALYRQGYRHCSRNYETF